MKWIFAYIPTLGFTAAAATTAIYGRDLWAALFFIMAVVTLPRYK